MTELTAILSRLKKVKRVGDNYLALCPAHNDINPSLSISQEDGKLLLHCHAGCSFGEIIKALGISGDNIRPQQIIKETYDYRDENGKLLYQVVRYEPKSFKQRRPDGDGWIWDLKGIEKVLYRLPELNEDIGLGKIIYIVEGEKDTNRLRDLGLASTTCSGGASQKWKPQYTFTLRGATIRIIPDNDEAGLNFAKRIATQLYGWVKSLKVLLLHELKDGDDVSDWLNDGHDIKVLEVIAQNSPEFIPTGSVSREEFMELRGHLIYLASKAPVNVFKRKKGRYY